MSIRIRIMATAGVAVLVSSVLGVSLASAATVAGPKVTAFAPVTGAVGTNVVVTGTGLTGATSVEFGGKAAAYTVNSATQITATVPSGALTGKIRVATAAGAVQAATVFTVVKAVVPKTTGFSPASGPVGTHVVITGTGFTGATSVRFAGAKEATYIVDSPTQITATVPTGAVTGKLRIATPAGAVQTASSFVISKLAAPVVSSIDRTGGWVDYPVEITGSRFTGATGVTFGGVAADRFTVDSDTQITAYVPTGAVTGPIRVTTPGGSAAAPTFTVYPMWYVGIDRPSAAVGDTVTFSLQFPGTVTLSSVTFNGVRATLAPYGAAFPGGVLLAQIRVVVPQGAATGPVSFTFAGDPATYTLPIPFTVINVPAPTVSSISRASGPVGSTVVITGTNLSRATSVTFGGVLATVGGIDSDTQITAVVPVGAVTGPIQVTTPTGVASSPTFTVTQ